ncbi:hypothetical protein PRUPE_4G235400 [Prunus persica]|uniref:Uncharacterized protein n=1 Tax=Prunus persica TaxID=3760 RepID=M5WJE1_PRUPE|nr:hypothetical protein PRUPE_4G235400 [Prunus persica]
MNLLTKFSNYRAIYLFNERMFCIGVQSTYNYFIRPQNFTPILSSQYQNYLKVLNHTIFAAEYSLKYTANFNLITQFYCFGPHRLCFVIMKTATKLSSS